MQELVPVIIEALKEHLKAYATDKAHFQQELDSLRTALSTLQSTIAPEASGPYDGGDPDNGDEAEDGADDDSSDDDENGGGGGDLANLASQDPKDIVQTVNQRKRELRELTRQLNQIKRDAKRQHRQEMRDRKTGT
jgi:regulator of replication initiation timing